ncbi:MAG TPA: hypothetical protein VFL64_20810 [Rhizobacter sp.]|nr:hypothetical protein [Rhizobacter sp.]
MSTIALSKFCDLFPPIDAAVLSETHCLLLLSQPADPALDERHSALVLVDRSASSARVLAEFPGASEMLLWTTPTPDGLAALVTSPGGTLWMLAADGGVKQIDDAFGDDGPQQYGYLNCSVQQGSFCCVGGMSNQLYRTPLGQARFERLDEAVLDREMDDTDAAIYGLANMGDGWLVAVGGGGMILALQGREVRRLDSGTNLMINAVCPLDAERFVACGVGGLVLEGSTQGWCRAAEVPGFDGYLSSVRVLGEHILWIGNRTLFRSRMGEAWNELARVPDAPGLSLFARGGPALWTVSPKHIGYSLDAQHWQWLPTEQIMVDVGPQ